MVEEVSYLVVGPSIKEAASYLGVAFSFLVEDPFLEGPFQVEASFLEEDLPYLEVGL